MKYYLHQMEYDIRIADEKGYVGKTGLGLKEALYRVSLMERPGEIEIEFSNFTDKQEEWGNEYLKQLQSER